MRTKEELQGVTELGSGHTVYQNTYAPEVLECFPNKHEEAPYMVKLNCPEFTSLCPKTGQPDFGRIVISYIPDHKLVESKSLKLYLFSFRNNGDFHEDCVNIINLPEDERSRMIDAEWQMAEGASNNEQYSTEIKIFANNRIGMFADISKVFTEKQIDITSMNVRTSKQGKATIIMTFDIHGTDELNRLTDKIRQIEGVLDIERTTG